MKIQELNKLELVVKTEYQYYNKLFTTLDINKIEWHELLIYDYIFVKSVNSDVGFCNYVYTTTDYMYYIVLDYYETTNNYICVSINIYSGDYIEFLFNTFNDAIEFIESNWTLGERTIVEKSLKIDIDYILNGN